jgi:hypothetical protein
MSEALQINCHFQEFSFPAFPALDSVAVIPTLRGSRLLKGKRHSYYFLNFQTSKGLRVDIPHFDIIRPGWQRLIKAMSAARAKASIWSCLAPLYHYGFSFLEQILLMTTPHTVTDLGSGRYAINLWSWFGYLIVDCLKRSVTWHMLDDDSDDVLGSSQWLDHSRRELYGMSFSLADSFARIANPTRSVSCRIFARQLETGARREVWNGQAADYLHDILLSPGGRFCVSCELGMYRDKSNKTYPSKVLILDQVTNNQWVLERFNVAAHACFDPSEEDIVYFSNHNFHFEHSSILALMKAGTYSVKFDGPATIFKYRLTPDGPQEIGSFSSPDFYRLTNMHVFRHRGRKLIAAMGFPDQVFLIDAENMQFVRKIQIKPRHKGRAATIGTITPSPDGNKLLAHTTDSLHVIDIESGEPDFIYNHAGYHTCSNHMIASPSWK